MRLLSSNCMTRLASLAVAGTLTVSAASAETTWRLTTFAGETSTYYTAMTLNLIERIEQLTAGEVKIEPYPEGVIAPAFEAYAAVRDGLADVGHLTPLYVVNENPANAIYGGHPGGMTPHMMLGWLYEGGGEELLQELRASEGMYSLIVSIGPGEIWHSHVKINTVEDLAGLRFRASGAWAELLGEYFDAAPTTVAGGEVYTLLERRGIDVAEWSTPQENIKAGLQNAAPYIITPGPHTNAWAFELMMPLATWEALDETTQEQVKAAAKLSTMEGLLDWMNDDIDAMKQLKAEGAAELHELPEDVINAIGDAGRKWAEAKATQGEEAGNDLMRRVTDSYYSYMDSWNETVATIN